MRCWFVIFLSLKFNDHFLNHRSISVALACAEKKTTNLYSYRQKINFFSLSLSRLDSFSLCVASSYTLYVATSIEHHNVKIRSPRAESTRILAGIEQHTKIDRVCFVIDQQLKETLIKKISRCSIYYHCARSQTLA